MFPGGFLQPVSICPHPTVSVPAAAVIRPLSHPAILGPPYLLEEEYLIMKHMRIVDLLGPVALLAPFLLPLQVTMAQTPTPPPGAAQVKSTPPASSAAPVATSGANSGPQVEVRDLSVSTNEVIVPVTVTDPNGKFVTNLSQADFKIFDEGQEQKISYFSAERNQPVVIGLLLDLSNSSRLHWKNYQESAIELALALLPDDDPKQRKYSGYLIAYGNEAELAVNTTYDSSKLTDRIRTLKPGGRCGALRRDLHGLYLACAGEGRAPGAASRHRHRR